LFVTGYSIDIETATLENEDFRRVLFTAKHQQLVLMTLQAGEEIGLEIHDNRDQFFRVESGTGEAIIDGETHPLGDGSVVIIPEGAEHNVRNSGTESLRMYTIYSPPQHPDGTVHHTKAEADAYEKAHHG
jgi:mannose-6-phosphate isomerase-like protein (cupin superfamily)